MKERFHYKKEMGQHFLLDPVIVDALAEASGVTRADGVLEIGPGRGTLTAALARRARRVITVELDRTLIAGLRAAMALYPNVEIIQGDIIRQDLPALAVKLGTPCRVAANLPYNITTPFLEKLLHARLPFTGIAIMVQKEVGDRMLAGPGDEGYGPLSLLVQFFTEPEVALSVPAGSFTPPPKVDSSFMLLTVRDAPPVAVKNDDVFFRVVRAAFAMRRKTILNNLSAGLSLGRERATEVLQTAGIAPTMRAEQLPMEAFARIADAVEG